MNQSLRDLDELQEKLFSSPLQRWPGCPKAGIYGLYKGRSLVYIGQSSSIKSRLREHLHREDGLSFDAWRAVEVPDIELRKHLEGLLIAKFAPRWNLNGTASSKRKAIMFRLTEDDIRKLREAAFRAGLNKTVYVQLALRAQFKKDDIK